MPLSNKTTVLVSRHGLLILAAIALAACGHDHDVSLVDAGSPMTVDSSPPMPETDGGTDASSPFLPADAAPPDANPLPVEAEGTFVFVGLAVGESAPAVYRAGRDGSDVEVIYQLPPGNYPLLGGSNAAPAKHWVQLLPTNSSTTFALTHTSDSSSGTVYLTPSGQELSSTSTFLKQAKFSTSGKYVAFLVDGVYGTSGSLHLAMTNGSPSIEVDDDVHAWDYKWSPTENILLFYDDTAKALKLLDAESGNISTLTSGILDANALINWPVDDFVWSPDGDRAAFLHRNEDVSNLELMDGDGSNRVALLVDANSASPPLWSQTGSHFIAMTESSKFANKWLSSRDPAGNTLATFETQMPSEVHRIEGTCGAGYITKYPYLSGSAPAYLSATGDVTLIIAPPFVDYLLFGERILFRRKGELFSTDCHGNDFASFGPDTYFESISHDESFVLVATPGNGLRVATLKGEPLLSTTADYYGSERIIGDSGFVIPRNDMREWLIEGTSSWHHVVPDVQMRRMLAPIRVE